MFHYQNSVNVIFHLCFQGEGEIVYIEKEYNIDSKSKTVILHTADKLCNTKLWERFG